MSFATYEFALEICILGVGVSTGSTSRRNNSKGRRLRFVFLLAVAEKLPTLLNDSGTPAWETTTNTICIAKVRA